jgi:predicted anti-sigma-YlaC factor YlaD
LLQRCECCRGYSAHAARVTRLSRTTLAAESPDIVEAVLSAVPRPRRPALVSVLRVLLAVVGLAQVALGAAELRGAAGPAGMRMDGASMMHFGHEIAAWDIALGVGFCWVAWRRSRSVGVVPTLATFIVVLTGFGVADLASGQVGLSRFLLHLWALAGLILLIMIDRGRPPAGPGTPRDSDPDHHRLSLVSAPAARSGPATRPPDL